jgi:uncharacterized repeat protein (TIGR03803 family)
MTNDSINPCDHPDWLNPLIPSIQRERQGPFAWISKAAHACLSHTLGLSIPLFPWDRRFAITSLAAAVMALALLPHSAVAATEVTLYVFPQSGKTGYYPTGDLYRDKFGSLYGTTYVGGAYDQGTVFRLSPPGPEQTNWNYSVLYHFQGGNDGGSPFGGVVMDANGTLYGTAYSGGVNREGVVFKLTPPGPGHPTWTETVLHNFSYDWVYKIHDGANPVSRLIMDASGALYGTTIGGGATNQFGYGYGTVFKLTPLDPEKNNWTETVLYYFAGGADGQSPSSGLTIDSTGALYGNTHYGGTGTCQDDLGYVVGCGTVFKLTPLDPEKNNWTKTTLYSFSGSPDGGLPAGTLHLDATGAIYGTTYGGGTSGGGTVFKITPPGAAQTSWTESVLYSFAGPDGAGPQGGLIADDSGRLYGTASGGGNYGFGVVFRLSPHPTMGQTAWSEEVLHYFNVTSGDNPFYGLVADPQGNLFGTANYGGTEKVGTIFEVTP